MQLIIRVKTALSIGELLSNQALVSGVSLILSIIIPIAVMILTQIYERKRSEKELEESQKQFNANMKTTLEQHGEDLDLQEKIGRTTVMPYLALCEDVAIEKQVGGVKLIPRIKNLGNGPALEIHMCSMERSTEEEKLGMPIVYKEPIETSYVNYRYADLIANNVLSVDSDTQFALLAESEDSSKVENENLGHILKFKIEYKDIYMNEYEQEYSINFTVHLGSGRICSGLPSLRRKVNLIDRLHNASLVTN